MARRNRKQTRRRRVSRSNARRSLPTTPSYNHDFYGLRPVEDRREFHPDGPSRPARSFKRSQHRLIVPEHIPQPYNQTRSPGFDYYYSIPNTIGFEAPRTVLVCVRRRRRKEVLHALKKTGKAGQKSPRRSAYSDIKC